MMEDGGVDFSSQLLLSNPDISSDFDEFLRSTRTCTHTHTCNPPGPDAAQHTHTCYHTHTRVLETGSEGEEEEDEPKKSRKPLGNREAVRKYREKKKAHAAYLEGEVKKLRLLNQQLLRRLQGQAALEAEVVRLRALLADLRGKIDGELGTFPFQKQRNNSGFRCNADIPCVGGDPAMVGWDEGGCERAIVDCRVEKNSDLERNLEMGAVNSMGAARNLVSSASHGE